MDSSYKVGDKVLVAHGHEIVPGVIAEVPGEFSSFYRVTIAAETYVPKAGLLHLDQVARA